MVGRFPETLITGAVGSDLHPITWDLDGKQYGGFGDGTGFGGNGGTLVSYGFYSIENGPVGATYTDLLMGPSGTGHGKPDSLLGVNSVMYVILNGQDGTHALRKTTNHFTSLGSAIITWTDATWFASGFFQAGQNYGSAPDGYVYISGKGSTLARVTPANIESSGSWEYFSGTPSAPAWSSNVADAVAVPNMAMAAVYDPPLGVWLQISGGPFDPQTYSWAPNPWGPWTTFATYTAGAFPGLAPSVSQAIAPKWFSADGTEFWMPFSGTGTWDRFNLFKAALALGAPEGVGFTLSGKAATLSRTRRLVLGRGTFALGGNAAQLRATRRISAAPGTVTLTGDAAALRAARRLAGSPGLFALSGLTASLEEGHRLVAGTGMFTLAGGTATLAQGRRLRAAAGIFTETGIHAELHVARHLTAARGAFGFTGPAARLLAARLLTAGAGHFVLIGDEATLRLARALAAETGTFLLTGEGADLILGDAPDLSWPGRLGILLPAPGRAVVALAGSRTAVRIDRSLSDTQH